MFKTGVLSLENLFLCYPFVYPPCDQAIKLIWFTVERFGRIVHFKLNPKFGLNVCQVKRSYLQVSVCVRRMFQWRYHVVCFPAIINVSGSTNFYLPPDSCWWNLVCSANCVQTRNSFCSCSGRTTWVDLVTEFQLTLESWSLASNLNHKMLFIIKTNRWLIVCCLDRISDLQALEWTQSDWDQFSIWPEGRD